MELAGDAISALDETSAVSVQEGTVLVELFVSYHKFSLNAPGCGSDDIH